MPHFELGRFQEDERQDGERDDVEFSPKQDEEEKRQRISSLFTMASVPATNNSAMPLEMASAPTVTA